MEQYAETQMDTEHGAAALSGSPVAKVLGQSRVLALSLSILQGLLSIPALSEPTVVEDFEKMRLRVCNALNNLVQLVPSECKSFSLAGRSGWSIDD
ncbi:hypothetical protein PINS_up003628 [Pythium insidiosum]|nr:hypothetical protein PINS_up003628 [Pythium insidiosum]